ncbi:Ferredoxin [hydrothermal vent metagenome]|uniref:Ferredoxin n=1 Tax=hydrothermal vent metagenome TaxID=652676 RepID=A0A3B1BXJ8_9ZZZZ
MFVTSSANTLKFDHEKCVNCDMCIIVCPHAVFARNGDVFVKNHDNCMECGACLLNCPTDAIEVDAGVGCAAAMMWAAINGKSEVSCGASMAKEKDSCCR